MTSSFFKWCARQFAGPEEATTAYYQEAVAAAAEVGILLDERLVPDGRPHYVPNLEGKRDKRQSYIASLRLDSDRTAWIAVTFRTFRQGGRTRIWSARDAAWRDFNSGRGMPRHHPSNDNDRSRNYSEQVARSLEQARLRQEEQERRLEEGRAAAAMAAVQAWDAAAPCDVDGHAYLVRKGVKAHGLRIATASRTARLLTTRGWKSMQVCAAGDLLIPVHDETGKLVNIQRISPNPKKPKLFISGGRMKGCRFRIEGTSGRTALVEGYATGATWHEATGDTVVVAFSAGQLPAVASTACADYVAADRDASGAGECKARETGLPVLLPADVGDWNDAGAKEAASALANHLCEAFTALRKLPPVELTTIKELEAEIKKGHEPREVAALALALARRMALQVPFNLSVDGIVRHLRRIAPVGKMNPATLEAIREALEWSVGMRKERALGGIRISESALARHDVELVDELPQLGPEDYRGVILLYTPMGSGKTRRIGKPFAQWASKQGESARFLALCHRRSLVAEASRVLEVRHYDDIVDEYAWAFDHMATCLPSIVKSGHSRIVDAAAYLFIDEIDQTLASIGSGISVASNKDWPEVFATLQTRVREAGCIIAADAGMSDTTIEFLESCRPGERFRILLQPHREADLQVEFGYGREDLAHAYGDAAARLAEGEKLWISCGAREQAKELERILCETLPDKRILLLHGEKQGNPEQQEFIADPEGVSRKYDAVIHTSVISSGISITHTGTEPHFNHGMLFASGHALSPADAIQMLRRVRYIRSWTIVAMPVRGKGMNDGEAILAGMQQAATVERPDIQRAPTTFDQFIAWTSANKDDYRGDFAAGLWWALEHQKFSVSRMTGGQDPEMKAKASCAREQLNKERRDAILSAPDLPLREIKILKDKLYRTEAEECVLRRHQIKLDLGVEEVDEETIKVWDEGRGPRRLDRFSAATQSLADRRDYDGEHLAPRKFSKARVIAYGKLFGTLEISPGMRMTAVQAQAILARIHKARHLLTYLRIVPAKWLWRKEGERIPEKSVFKLLNEIFDLMDLRLKRREGTATHTSGLNFLGETGASVGRKQRHHFYELEANRFEHALTWAGRRNAVRVVEVVSPAHRHADNDDDPGCCADMARSSPEQWRGSS